MNIKHFHFAAYALLLATGASATTVSSVAVANEWFESNDAFTAFSVREPGDLYLRTFGVPQFNRSAIEFSLSNISGGATIQSAIFSIGAGGTSEAGGHFIFYGYGGDGYITVADATRTSKFLGSLPTISRWEYPYYSVDATDLVKQLVAQESAFVGVLITFAEQGPFKNEWPGGDLCGREADMYWGYNCPVGYLPTLTVEYADAVAVSEPSTIVLLSVALAGLGAIRRRKLTKYA